MRQLTKIAETGSLTTRERAEALRARLPDVTADPILAVIEESKRLMPSVRRTRRLPDVGLHRPVEHDEADDALSRHFFGALLKTTPTTAAGAVEFARYVLAYNRFQGGTLDEKDLARALILIAAASAA